MSDLTSPLGLGARLRRLLAALDGAVQAEYDRRAVPFRPRYYPVVRQLLASGPASVGALSAGAGVTQPAVTQTLNEMRRAGLVTLGEGADRRERRVSLTDAGRALAADLAPLWSAVEAAARDLEAEAGPLGQVLDAAAAALQREPFGARIAKALPR
jgi:DNA-binding MarR family transcriptional regulator